MVKETYDEATTGGIRFRPPCTSWVLSNDGAADLTVKVDGAVYTLKPGEVLEGTPGDRLETFQALTAGGTWRLVVEKP